LYILPLGALGRTLDGWVGYVKGRFSTAMLFTLITTLAFVLIERGRRISKDDGFYLSKRELLELRGRCMRVI
jgi:hypothetical protein